MTDLRIKAQYLLSLKGKLTVRINGKEGTSRAFETGDFVTLILKIPRALGTETVCASLINDFSSKIETVPFIWTREEKDFDVYTCDLFTGEVGLFFLRFDIDTLIGKLYAKKGEFCDLAFSAFYQEAPHTIQFSVSEFIYKKPSWLLGGTVYHIFVDRFCRAKDTPFRKDSIYNPDWDGGIPEYPEYPGAHLENNVFFGGNLWGVIEKLEYIKSLGVNLIYLSPIFTSYSNHKYDTGDYMSVDEGFGGDAALCELISKAKEKGIRIMLDGVFNHTGADSLYFNKYGKYNAVGAYQSKDSPYYQWYDFKDYPDKYTCWWDIDILPRINTENKECQEYFAGKGGVIDKWSKLGACAFRLDVVDELPDSFVEKIKTRLDKNNRYSYLLGEVWEDASNKIAYGKRRKYYLGRELDGVMNYPIREGIVDYLRYGNTEKLTYAVCEVIDNTPKRILDTTLNLIGTHDTKRITTALCAPDETGKTNEELSKYKMDKHSYARAVELLKIAYLIEATLPGIPSIYYGDEVGVEGYKDPFNRMPYPWKNQNKELLGYYIEIGKIRSKSSVYKDGVFRLLTVTKDLFAFARIKGTSSFVTVINNTENEIKLSSNKLRMIFGGKRKDGEISIHGKSGIIINTSTDNLENIELI